MALDRRRKGYTSEGTGSARSPNPTDDAMTLLRALAAMFVLALAGCVETRFESPIGDNIETCDARWKGIWAEADEANRDRPGDSMAFYVDDDCKFIVLDDPDKNGVAKQIHIPVNYVHADGKDYVVVTDAALKPLADIKPPHGITPAPEKSYFFARYTLRRDRLDIYQVDDERMAKLVIDGAVDGTVDKTHNELHVYVHGSRAEMQTLVRTRPIFKDKPTKFARSSQTLADFRKSQQRATPGKGTP